jgi:DNA replication and repair protein RecF
VLLTGANGAGKTNLLEALHVGSQGFSPRTRTSQRLIRFGESAARVALAASSRDAQRATEVRLWANGAKEVSLDGARLANADALRTTLATLVFTPDRLAIVKGGPLVRRSYFDRMLGRIAPQHVDLPVEYGRTLAQRNAALRRVRAGLSSHSALEPWTRELAARGTELDRARAELVRALATGFAEEGEFLGLNRAAVRYDARELTVDELEERLGPDVERGTTGLGPHLRDVAISAEDRDLRQFGSQGEQRTAVLALTLAEATLLAARRGEAPLLLLDDVFSELDARRRSALLGRLPAGGQTVITATHAPDGLAPDLLVHVTPGAARAA